MLYCVVVLSGGVCCCSVVFWMFWPLWTSIFVWSFDEVRQVSSADPLIINSMIVVNLHLFFLLYLSFRVLTHRYIDCGQFKTPPNWWTVCGGARSLRFVICYLFHWSFWIDINALPNSSITLRAVCALHSLLMQVSHRLLSRPYNWKSMAFSLPQSQLRTAPHQIKHTES